MYRRACGKLNELSGALSCARYWHEGASASKPSNKHDVQKTCSQMLGVLASVGHSRAPSTVLAVRCLFCLRGERNLRTDISTIWQDMEELCDGLCSCPKLSPSNSSMAALMLSPCCPMIDSGHAAVVQLLKSGFGLAKAPIAVLRLFFVSYICMCNFYYH